VPLLGAPGGELREAVLGDCITDALLRATLFAHFFAPDQTSPSCWHCVLRLSMPA
jgi:hypothetical protein